MPTWELHITGRVQGVGFRPRVYILARRHGISGSISNGVDGVRVTFMAESIRQAEAICQLLLNQAPRLAVITGHHLRQLPDSPVKGFTIRESDAGEKASLLLSPDFSICGECRQDILDSPKRRDYAFTTCTNCGPRFSITRRIPYDRPETTVAPFSMCPSCQQEYQNPEDRRFFSQTNSCPACGITLFLDGQSGLSTPEIIAAVISRWEAGQVVALQGIGGFLLTSDANSPVAIQRLRDRKHRPDKPLAVMYPTPERVSGAFTLPPEALRALLSPVGPIVLLSPLADTDTELALDHITPGLSRVGIMLPYTPLFQLLLSAYGRPIVATSGNISGEPIVFRASDRDQLKSVADHTLHHNLEILTPQDDSVVQYTNSGRRVILRRSRGMAPTLLVPSRHLVAEDILAAGADLKASFCIHHRGNSYTSQYLGDLNSFTAQQHYRHTLRHLKDVLGASPTRILHDLHPNYASGAIAEQLAKDWGVATQSIQHHEAHFAAVLGENDLLDSPNPVIGIIWDGTGLGTDGHIWGGETFRYRQGVMHRISHLEYFSHFAGDKLSREPRLAALSMARSIPEAEDLLSTKFSTRELRTYEHLISGSQLRSSSMGRLFDAAASLIMGIDYQSYEGMASSRLEALAGKGLSTSAGQSPYPIRIAPNGNIPGREILRAVVVDIVDGSPPESVAARFHLTLVEMIKQLADWSETRHLAFSGGVFQNLLLVQLIEEHLSARHQLYFHRNLSPNDENIGFGQLVRYSIQQRAQSGSSTVKTTNHVLSYTR